MTIDELFADLENPVLSDFLNYLRIEKGLSLNTLKAYQSDLLIFFEYLQKNDLKFGAIGHSEITDFLWAQKTNGKEATTLTRYIESIRQLYKFMVGEGKLKKNPTDVMSLPKKAERLPRVLSVQEMSRLLGNIIPAEKATETRKMPGGMEERGAKFWAAFELMYATGMRVSELVNLRDSQVDLNSNYVRVFGKGGKERIIPFGNRAETALRKHFEIRNRVRKKRLMSNGKDYVFTSSHGGAMSRSTFLIQLKKLKNAAGIRGDISPHVLRHSF